MSRCGDVRLGSPPLPTAHCWLPTMPRIPTGGSVTRESRAAGLLGGARNTMPDSLFSRRQFVKAAGAMAGSSLLRPVAIFGQSPGSHAQEAGSQIDAPPDYTLTIAVKP